MDESLKELDKRLDEAFDSKEMNDAFDALETKMFFNTRDNYVSPDKICNRYNTKEYIDAKNSLLSSNLI
jgi:hypothetical protein